jgi:tRNA-2-methylthio-N6-dimethylallyladenosine synthase
LVNTLFETGNKQFVEIRKYNAVKRINPKESRRSWLYGERLKVSFLKRKLLTVVGPDACKDLPNLLAEVEEGRDAINVICRR